MSDAGRSRPTCSWSAPGRAGRRPPTTWLATAIDVTVVEKAAFPREKVCGDGLTPRSVKAIHGHGRSTPTTPGFEQVIGLRVHARRTTIQLPWPDLTSFPPYGLVMPREGFDHLLAQRAVKAGARLLERTEAVAPRVRRRLRAPARRCGPRASVTRSPPRSAPATCSPPTARRAGSQRRPASAATPGGRSASRRAGTYRVDYHPGPWIESWLDLWDGDLLLPGLRLAVPGRRRADQPRRGAAEHVRELQGHLGAAAVRRVRADAPARVGDRRGHGGGRVCCRGRCRWASTARRGRCPGCCWSATPPAR